jgi:DNA-binding CsgD family transcriptional regulator
MSQVTDDWERWATHGVTVTLAVEDADRLLASLPLAAGEPSRSGSITKKPEQTLTARLTVHLTLCPAASDPQLPLWPGTAELSDGAEGELRLALSFPGSRPNVSSEPETIGEPFAGEAQLIAGEGGPRQTLQVHASLALARQPGKHLSTYGRAHSPGQALPALTHRERQVLTSLASGEPIKRVSRLLGISVHTCRGYVKSLHSKLSVSSQLEMVVKAQKLGLVDELGDLEELEESSVPALPERITRRGPAHQGPALPQRWNVSNRPARDLRAGTP